MLASLERFVRARPCVRGPMVVEHFTRGLGRAVTERGHVALCGGSVHVALTGPHGAELFSTVERESVRDGDGVLHHDARGGLFARASAWLAGTSHLDAEFHAAVLAYDDASATLHLTPRSRWAELQHLVVRVATQGSSAGQPERALAVDERGDWLRVDLHALRFEAHVDVPSPSTAGTSLEL